MRKEYFQSLGNRKVVVFTSQKRAHDYYAVRPFRIMESLRKLNYELAIFHNWKRWEKFGKSIFRATFFLVKYRIKGYSHILVFNAYGGFYRFLFRSLGYKIHLDIRDDLYLQQISTGLSNKERRLSDYYDRINKVSCNCSDVITVSSPCLLSYYVQRYDISDDRISTLINGLTSSVVSEKAEYNFDFVYLGSNSKASGFDDFLHFVKYCSEAKPHWRFKALVAEVNDFTKERAIWIEELSNLDYEGNVAPHLVHGILSKCSVGILFLDEKDEMNNLRVSNRFVDYVGSGIPVLSSHIRCQGGIINQNQLGKLCSPDNVSKLESAEAILKNRDFFSSNCRKYSENDLMMMANLITLGY